MSSKSGKALRQRELRRVLSTLDAPQGPHAVHMQSPLMLHYATVRVEAEEGHAPRSPSQRTDIRVCTSTLVFLVHAVIL